MARSNNNNKLKAFVRFDGSGRVVSSSLIVQAFKPKVGKWKEIDAKECCNYTTTTTTTVTSYSFRMSVGVGTQAACDNPNTAFYYAATPTLSVGTLLYSDAALTILVGSQYYYNNITKIVYITTSGEITSTSTCGK